MSDNDKILVSSEVSIREREKKKKKREMDKKMQARWAEKPYQVSPDVDMSQALAKVRTNDATIPIGLSRFQGSYLYNKQAPPKGNH